MGFDSLQWAADVLGCDRTEAEERVSAAAEKTPIHDLGFFERGGSLAKLKARARKGDKDAAATVREIEQAFADNPPAPIRHTYSRREEAELVTPLTRREQAEASTSPSPVDTASAFI